MVNIIQNSISNAVEHPVVLQGVGTSQLRDKPNLVPGDRQPTILQRTEQDFIGTILNELSSDRSVQALSGKINSSSPSQVLKFLQPVHRTFYVVLLEIVCNPFGRRCGSGSSSSSALVRDNQPLILRSCCRHPCNSFCP